MDQRVKRIEKFKEEFVEYIKKTFLKNKIDQFFDIITHYPDSEATIRDIKNCLNSYPV